MIQNRRNKVLSLHEPQNLITLDQIETPQFNETRRRVLTQVEDEHPKLVLPRIKLGNNHKNLPSNNNEKKFKLTGAKEAFFQPRQLNKLPQILKGLQKSDNPSQPDFRKMRQDRYKASAYTLDVNE